MSTGIIEQRTGTMAAPPSIRQALERVNLVQEVLAHIMKDGTHYGGSFPGDTKKNLLKPGADSLCLAFQLAPEFEVIERDLGNGHREYRTNCTLKTQGSGVLVATGVGCCSTMESRYRYRNAALKCPKCGKDTIIKGKEEYGGGWVCFAKKGGCNAKWKDGDREIEGQERGKVENTDPADVWNTVLKISKKRAFVDASITATAASDIFTQDLEDIAEDLKVQEAKRAAEAKAAATATPPAQPAPKPAPDGRKLDQEEQAAAESQATPAPSAPAPAQPENELLAALVDTLAIAKTRDEVKAAYKMFEGLNPDPTTKGQGWKLYKTALNNAPEKGA